ncbi:MAG TPA: hypothetical protein VJ023_16345 [Pyrinomonadaceae bacterium]|nr:hypothetical protein [Pyrinomonadaceae bacterium]
MNTPTHRSLEILAAIGLGIGAVFGLAGTLVSEDSVRQLFWAIDGVALVVAAALLTLRFLRLGNDLVADARERARKFDAEPSTLTGLRFPETAWPQGVSGALFPRFSHQTTQVNLNVNLHHS